MRPQTATLMAHAPPPCTSVKPLQRPSQTAGAMHLCSSSGLETPERALSSIVSSTRHE